MKTQHTKLIAGASVLLALLAPAAGVETRAVPTWTALSAELSAYRGELAALRKDFGVRELPPGRWYLLGVGPRRKLIYRDGVLRDAVSGEVLRTWAFEEDLIVPSVGVVAMRTAEGEVFIQEDERGVEVIAPGKREFLTESPVKLPDFAGHRHSRVLRVLHQELLMNIVPAGPVPNFMVYPKPWYRDGAMMAFAFVRTGNAGLLGDWIRGLRDPFDRNNAGISEPDNLGQSLYLASLAGGKEHPLVAKVLAELPRFERRDASGKFIVGRTDGAEHSVYQTKWLKFGLQALGLPDEWAIPRIADGYDTLFWWDFIDPAFAPPPARDSMDYPYLTWAGAHRHGQKKGRLSNLDYPLTWEAKASEASYEGMRLVGEDYVKQKICAPHTWHAAEAFLYLLDDR